MQTSRRQHDGICFLVKLEEYVNQLRYGATDSLEQVSWDRDKWIWDNWAGNMSLLYSSDFFAQESNPKAGVNFSYVT